RRRGGRDKDRDRDRDRDRNRTPDIAADGGEMLDAIASAPFLLSVQTAAGPDEVSSLEDQADVTPPDASRAEQPDSPPAEQDVQPEREGDQVVADDTSVPETVDHEIAATVTEVSESTSSVEMEREPEAIEAEPGESQRHPIHGEPEQPAEPSPAPRRIGWWNRRKTG